jgi:hypothetical protein
MGIKETINVGLVLIRIGLVFGIAYRRREKSTQGLRLRDLGPYSNMIPLIISGFPARGANNA